VTVYFRLLPEHQRPKGSRSRMAKSRRRLKNLHRRLMRPTEGVQARPQDHKFWRIFAAQGGACYLCVDLFADDDWATYDHVRPRHLGFGRLGNSLLAHPYCNSRKGGRAPTPCELLYLEAVNLSLPWVDVQADRPKRDAAVWLPLRARLAAALTE
jgi:5-methylcytosine-specific restriction endonuclease McrA